MHMQCKSYEYHMDIVVSSTYFSQIEVTSSRAKLALWLVSSPNGKRKREGDSAAGEEHFGVARGSRWLRYRTSFPFRQLTPQWA